MPRPAPPGAEQQRLREITEQVVLAEEMGFEHVWFVEHHFLTEWAHSSAPEVMLAVLSQHTTKMRLGFGVVLLPVHHPLHVAAKTATLDIMSDGRVNVGVGRAGNPYQLEPFGVKLEDTRGIWEKTATDCFGDIGRFVRSEHSSVSGKSPSRQPVSLTIPWRGSQ